MRIRRTPQLLFTAILATALLPIQAQNNAEPDDYQQGNYGRIRTAEAGVALVRAEASGREGEPSRVDVNSPVFPGDQLSTSNEGRAEVQLAGGALVRIDRASFVTFLALPDPYAEIADNTVLKVLRGVVRISASASRGSEFRIDTPAASVYLLGDADVRIEVMDGGSTRVASRRGVAEVVGDGGSVIVRGGTRSRIEVGAVPDSSQPFNTFAEDPFDRWCASLDENIRSHAQASNADAAAYDSLPDEVRPYYSELSANGTWVNLPTYGYAWVPGGVATGFRPYLNGYWAYGPGGYFWVSYEPWGWAPYHYGRWTWATGFGWCWIPGRVFAGAWVSWSWGSSYVGWCPLDYWNRPCYYGTRYYGYYDAHCWTFVEPTHLHHRGGYHRYGVPVQRAGDAIARNAVVTRPPRVSPDELARDAGQRDRAARDAAASRQGRTRTSSEATTAPRRFDQAESEWRNRLGSVAGRGDAGRSTADSTRAPRTRATQEFRRVPSAPSAVDVPQRRRSSDRGNGPISSAPIERPRAARPSAPDRPVDSGARNQHIETDRSVSQRRLTDSPGITRVPRSDGAIRELYRRVAPARPQRPSNEDAGADARKSAPEPKAPPAAGARRGGQSSARTDGSRAKAPARESRPAQSRGQSGGRGGSKRR